MGFAPIIASSTSNCEPNRSNSMGNAGFVANVRNVDAESRVKAELRRFVEP